MSVCLLALWSDSLTYTIAKALAFSGHRAQIWIADVERDRGSQWSLSARIAGIPGVTLVTDRDARPPERIGRLIVQGHPQLPRFRHLLDLLASRAATITVISAGDRSRTPPLARRLQWQEWRWYGRWLFKVSRVAYKDGFHGLDLWGLWKPRRVVGFDAHSKILQDDGLFQALHAHDWTVEACRPYRANFLGSRDPEARARILESIEPYFTAEAGHPGSQSPKPMRWLAYSDTQPAALSGQAFLEVLTQSDFTLAPPGYSLVTHRPVEALLRGSIPVLHSSELDLYDLDLRDGETCIAVPQGGWADAMRRILAMDEEVIQGMRRAIAALVPAKVAYPALARDIARRLGVEEG